MINKPLITPILFLIFNRPDTTQKVFAEIRKAKPKRLYVAADGPRLDKPGEAEKCQAARAIIKQVDWDCEVKTLLRDQNMGCKIAVSSAIDWFFNHVEEGIILEDDCLPHPTFFRFCEELLERYKDDERIMMISGNNFQFKKKRNTYSYYFSRYTHIWGWASWRRAWQHYDVGMKLWPEIYKSGWLKDILVNSSSVRYWREIFQAVYEGRINTWDYQWMFTCWSQSGYTILPNVNLISNIGFNEDGTHTKGSSRVANLAVETINFPLRHPPFVIRDAKADDFTQKVVIGNSTLLSRTKGKAKRRIRKMLPFYHN